MFCNGTLHCNEQPKMVLYGATKVLWTRETPLLPCAILLIDLQTAVTVKTIKDCKLFLQNLKSHNAQFCSTPKKSSQHVCRETVILQITCTKRDDSPFTLYLLVFGTAQLAHPISASGGHQMLRNNFSQRWKFLSFQQNFNLVYIYSNLSTWRHARVISRALVPCSAVLYKKKLQ